MVPEERKEVRMRRKYGRKKAEQEEKEEEEVMSGWV